MSTDPQVSIIIVNHRSQKVLQDCIASIRAGRHPFPVEVIIVDNQAEMADSYRGRTADIVIRQMSTSHRVGFAQASNLGASTAQGEYFLFLNPDIVLDENTIYFLREALTSNLQVGITTGRLRNPDGSFQPSCRKFPTLKNIVFSRGSIPASILGGGKNGYTLPEFDTPTEVDAAAAALMMISKRNFKQLGGFDERFYLYMEDTDICYRLHCSGKKVLYLPQAGAVHLWGYSTGHYRFRRIIWHHRSVWRYFVKHHQSAYTFTVLAPLLIVNCFLSLALELFTLRR